VCFIHLNDCLLHARTGILRHSYQHAAATLATQDPNRPKGLARYCDLDDRLCNYKHTSASYAEVCWDNATSLARLLQGEGGGAQAAALGKKGRAALEGLESSLSMLDGSLQQLSTKAALMLDRVKAALPGPMQVTALSQSLLIAVMAQAFRAQAWLANQHVLDHRLLKFRSFNHHSLNRCLINHPYFPFQTSAAPCLTPVLVPRVPDGPHSR
jgi:hypothetical protein